MSNADRISKECHRESLPWCLRCGDLLEVGQNRIRHLHDGEAFILVCDCGATVTCDCEIVFSAKVVKEFK
jgi:hypothetical protein